jgi:putative transposase
MFDQQCWYYNVILQITYDHHFENGYFNKNKFTFIDLRKLLRQHKYFDERSNGLIFQGFDFDENRSQNPIPEWWKPKDVHNRVPRGAVAKFTSSLNSAISNFKNGNTTKFKMKFKSKKSVTEMLHFEDSSFPSFIRHIESRYWFTSKTGKKSFISYSDIKSKKGLEVLHEKETDRFYLHVPIDRNWFPDEDRRTENQGKYFFKKKRVIALDPGVRKFLTGYDPEGKCFFLGEGAHKKITSLFKKIDELQSKNDKENSSYVSTFCLWKKMKNLVSELHWKCASFLVENYDIILLPEFRVQQMVIKEKTKVRLGRLTKRLMNMFSFYKFKEKLSFKCETYNKKLLIVDESFTSCTCGFCGSINRPKGSEVYNCNSCKLKIDRDINGARNILIKNSTLR